LYWVMVTHVCGVAADSIILTVNPLPSVFLGGDTTICNDESITLDAGPGFAGYIWQDGSTARTFTADAAGIYYVEVTDVNGCTDKDTIAISVDPRPTVQLSDEGTLYLCVPAITLDAGKNCESYYWHDGSTGRYLVLNKTGDYWVTVANGNCTATAYVTVNHCHEIWVPNAFTPNGDGLNDCFQAVSVDNEIINFRMYIYNRYGQLVFETEDITDCWTGLYPSDGDQVAPQGVYHWKILYDGVGNVLLEEEGIKAGHVTLIR